MNAATIRLLISKGLSADDLLAVAEAMERKADPTNAERQQRHRAKERNAVTVTRDPPIDITHTPSSVDLPDGKSQNSAAWKKPEFCESDQIWTDFLKNRQRRRLPNTETAFTGFLADIQRIADDEWPPGKLLTHAARKGWGGIYDPRDQGNGRTGNNPSQRATSTRSAAQQAIERLQHTG